MGWWGQGVEEAIEARYLTRGSESSWEFITVWQHMSGAEALKWLHAAEHLLALASSRSQFSQDWKLTTDAGSRLVGIWALTELHVLKLLKLYVCIIPLS